MTFLQLARRWAAANSVAELCRRAGYGPRSATMHQIQKWIKGSRKTLPWDKRVAVGHVVDPEQSTDWHAQQKRFSIRN